MCGSTVDIQSVTAEIRRERKRKKKNKLQGKNIMACPIPLGSHKIHTAEYYLQSIQQSNKLETIKMYISNCIMPAVSFAATVHTHPALTKFNTFLHH